MKYLVLMLTLLLFAPPLIAAEDFTGKWTGSFTTTRDDGTERAQGIVLDLKQKGAELTGTAGPTEERQWPLKGKVDANKVTFDLESTEGSIKFTLVFAEGHLKGDAVSEQGGQTRKAKIDAQRKTTF